MRIVVVTDVGVDNLVPPRCRKPRHGSIEIAVTCDLTEVLAAAIDLVAHVSTYGRLAGSDEQDYYFEPSVGFLKQETWTVEELATMIGRPGRWGSAVPSAEVPGQGAYEIQKRHREVEARVAGAVVSDQSTVYSKVAEPCYCVRYTPSFNWSSCDLIVRDAPAFTPVHFQQERAWSRFFNAMALAAAKRLQDALQRTSDQVGGHEDRIEVFCPEVFRFDAARWHAERELHRTREQFDEIVNDLRRTPGGDVVAFCSEELALADQLADVLACLRDDGAAQRVRAEAAVRYDRWIRSVEEGGDGGDVAPAV